MMAQRKAWSVALATIGAAVVAACGGGEAKQPETDAAPAAGYGRSINVVVEPVVVASFMDVVRLVGMVQADRDVTVAAEETGVIRALYVEKGRRVRAGDAIAKIDDAVLAAQVEQAQAESKLAAETYERQRRLWAEEKIGSELTYLQAKYRAETAEASAKALAARLQRTTIRAPIDGILDARLVEVGTMVMPGTAVGRIMDADTVKVLGGVPERFSADIRRGAVAQISFDALGGRAFEGNVAFVGASVDGQDRTFPIEVMVPNPGGVIKSGMVANVQVSRRILDDAISIPQEAVQRVEDGYVAFVVKDRDGVSVIESRPVRLGPSQRGRVVIESGLEPGDLLVVVGQKDVAAGDLVRVVEQREVGVR